MFLLFLGEIPVLEVSLPCSFPIMRPLWSSLPIKFPDQVRPALQPLQAGQTKQGVHRHRRICTEGRGQPESFPPPSAWHRGAKLPSEHRVGHEPVRMLFTVPPPSPLLRKGKGQRRFDPEVGPTACPLQFSNAQGTAQSQAVSLRNQGSQQQLSPTISILCSTCDAPSPFSLCGRGKIFFPFSCFQ